VIQTVPQASARPAHIGYVLKVFPRVSETFIANEMVAMEGLGTEVTTFSLHASDGAARHAVLRQKRGPTIQVDAAPTPSEDAVRRTANDLASRFALGEDERRRLLPRKYVRLALQLADLAVERRVTHLHAHFASRATHVAALVAAMTGLPYTFTAHAKDLYHRDVDAEALRWKLAHARHCITVTDYNRAYLERLVAAMPGQGDKIVRLYNGVDLDRFRAAPPASGDAPVILAIGRLVPKKGFAVLVDACRLLRDGGLQFRCEIVGGGPEEAALRAAINAVQLGDCVRLLGVMSSEEVAERLRQATVVTLPCIVADDGNVDALPTVLLEAMATGRAAVSTTISGIPEIVVSGQTGLLVRPGDAPALADALATICADPLLAATMGARGRNRCEQLFDLRANAACLQRLLVADEYSAGIA
jgi:glycosyltransferase involved in cell wall biosynthesis